MTDMTPRQPDGDGVTRAVAAYRRSEGESAPIPGNDSAVQEHDGREYVVLRNVNGILAVYGFRADGKLQRLVEWPEDLEQW